MNAVPAIIVIADGDPEFRTSLVDVLNDRGYDVHPLRNTAEARELLERERVDLIVADAHQPEVGSVALAIELRERGDLTPIVLVNTNYIEGLQFPAVHVIPRLFELDTLIAVVRRGLAGDARVL